MKTLAPVLLAASLLAGCQNGGSPLDGTGSGASAQLSALEARVATLEQWKAKHEKAIDFVQQVYDAQQAQLAEARKNQLDPTAIFAVPIAADVAGGQVEGPNSACVTVVEAWDFA